MNGTLSVRGLHAGYPGRAVLQNIKFGPIAAGSLVALVGPNAVGKSMPIKALAGLRPSEGEM